jgi:hypothetical protein
VGRRGVVTFLAAGLTSAAWLMFALGPALATITAAASGNRCFVGDIRYSWRLPETGADFERSAPVSLALLAGAIVAAVATGAAAVTRRLGLSRLLPPLIALLVVGGGLVPFVACRWETSASDGEFPFLLLPLGLTAGVACVGVLVADWLTKTDRRSVEGARAG